MNKTMRALLAGATTTGLLLGGTVPVQAHAAPAVMPSYGDFGSWTFKDYIDADSKKDTITIEEIPANYGHAYKVTVTTATKRTSTLTSYTEPNTSWPLEDVKQVDPVGGKELLMTVWRDTDYERNGRLISYRVMTWRNNQLVWEYAPGDPEFAAGTVAEWWAQVNYSAKNKAGYRLFKSHGKWYDDHFSLTWNSSKKRWTGYVVRSVWKSGHWAKYKSYWGLKLTSSQAKKYKAIPGNGD